MIGRNKQERGREALEIVELRCFVAKCVDVLDVVSSWTGSVVELGIIIIIVFE